MYVQQEKHEGLYSELTKRHQSNIAVGLIPILLIVFFTNFECVITYKWCLFLNGYYGAPANNDQLSWCSTYFYHISQNLWKIKQINLKDHSKIKLHQVWLFIWPDAYLLATCLQTVETCSGQMGYKTYLREVINTIYFLFIVTFTPCKGMSTNIIHYTYLSKLLKKQSGLENSKEGSEID